MRQLLEPACGTGRLVAELAARGYGVTGFDLSEPSLAYLRRRLARRKLQATVFHADMVDFSLPRPVDAAYNTFDSFRHLLTEQDARRHLQCVADQLRPGGIYILGFHLLPPDADEECTERWTERQGRTQVTVTLRVVASDRRRRLGVDPHQPAGPPRFERSCGSATSSPCGCTRLASSADCWRKSRRSNCWTCTISGTKSINRCN